MTQSYFVSNWWAWYLIKFKTYSQRVDLPEFFYPRSKVASQFFVIISAILSFDHGHSAIEVISIFPDFTITSAPKLFVSFCFNYDKLGVGQCSWIVAIPYSGYNTEGLSLQTIVMELFIYNSILLFFGFFYDFSYIFPLWSSTP